MTRRTCKWCNDPLRRERRIPLCISCRVVGATIFFTGAAVAGIVYGILQKVFG